MAFLFEELGVKDDSFSYFDGCSGNIPFCRSLTKRHLNIKGTIMKICQDCLQFKNRATNWNNTHGVTTDPLPFISEIVKGHKNLIFEERRVDGTGWIAGIFRCHKCKQWWELLAWPAMGQLDVRSYIPGYHSIL